MCKVCTEAVRCFERQKMLKCAENDVAVCAPPANYCINIQLMQTIDMFILLHYTTVYDDLY